MGIGRERVGIDPIRGLPSEGSGFKPTIVIGFKPLDGGEQVVFGVEEVLLRSGHREHHN